jgi:hypothetical protein
VGEPSNREIVERYLAAIPGDQQTLRALRHEDYVEDWPQSGERVRGADRMAAISAAYPGGLPSGSVERIVGSEDQWVITPSYSVLKIAGSGDVYTALLRATYADGSDWWVTTFIELKDGKVIHATTLFAPRLDSPEWRREWVELVDEA